MGKISLVMNAPANGKWQFSTFLNFEKSKTKSDLFVLFSKIGHQIDYSKFRPCRQILEIYRDWLLSMNTINALNWVLPRCPSRLSLKIQKFWILNFTFMHLLIIKQMFESEMIC